MTTHLTPSSDLPLVIIITGPTASGKSQFALEMASQIKGEIVNADSMQCYEHLPILTACPTPADCAVIPHHLYGILGDDQIGSAGWWVQTAESVISQILERGSVPILVGGTGLYLLAMTQGLSTLPEIPPEIRQVARARAQDDSFFEYVCAKDPQVQYRLEAADTQRLTRALEVMMATGRSLFDWQQDPRQPSPYTFQTHRLIPERDELYRRINDRFVGMIEKGAIEEVEALLDRPVRQDSPILRAVGVKEIQGYLRGQLTKDQMIELGQQSTRQYAKRQLTWLKGQGGGK